MDEALLWQQIEDQGEREPLITRGEARAVIQMLHLLTERCDVAGELAERLARRLPAE
ncbi:hypothetical protein ACFY1A_20980 [Streptomyces sp. NPDC001520]|uniref:hypothetical protein n=1 Tax=Streptomyces sp. NPDC001520 TaxID=3364581 RepID=UPI003688E89A